MAVTSLDRMKKCGHPCDKDVHVAWEFAGTHCGFHGNMPARSQLFLTHTIEMGVRRTTWPLRRRATTFSHQRFDTCCETRGVIFDIFDAWVWRFGAGKREADHQNVRIRSSTWTPPAHIPPPAQFPLPFLHGTAFIVITTYDLHCINGTE